MNVWLGRVLVLLWCAIALALAVHFSAYGMPLWASVVLMALLMRRLTNAPPRRAWWQRARP